MSRVTVSIRERKRKGGIIGLYLEIYRGYTTTEKGNIKPTRKRQTLDYFLYENPKNASQRSHNKEVKRKVEAIKGQTLKELINNKYGFTSETKVKLDFLKYFEKLTNERLSSKGNYGNWDSVLKHLKKYVGNNISFESVDTEFCKGFKEYLEKATTKSGSKLSNNSITSYFNKFRASLNQAIEDEIILSNPAQKISIPKVIEQEREFLTEEEVKRLSETECRYEVLKRAFLFSCLTGLRWADVQKLEWNQLKKEADGWKIVFHQQKTKGLQYQYIPDQAKNLLKKPIEGHERIFVGLRYSSYMNTALSQWMLKARITKNITFHCARHTYACMLLEKGVDIYTVSKLLGHKEVRTTQIYAKILDKGKANAVKTLNIL